MAESCHDPVVHPRHYTWIPGIECIAVSKHFSFCLGNVIKYVWRAGLKASSTRLEDLQKAKEYLLIEIQFEKDRLAGIQGIPALPDTWVEDR